MHIPKLDGVLELTICRSMAAELDEYLRSNVLYWPVTPSNPLGDRMPQLTSGSLLEHLTRAEAALNELSPSQRIELESTRQLHDRVRQAHQTAYFARAVRELNSRLDAWAWYLDDYARHPSDLAAYYPHEIRTRVKVELLVQVLNHNVPAHSRTRLIKLDELLRGAFVAGPFVWDERLESFFPKSPCWWLYGQLRD